MKVSAFADGIKNGCMNSFAVGKYNNFPFSIFNFPFVQPCDKLKFDGFCGKNVTGRVREKICIVGADAHIGPFAE